MHSQLCHKIINTYSLYAFVTNLWNKTHIIRSRVSGVPLKTEARRRGVPARFVVTNNNSNKTRTVFLDELTRRIHKTQ